MISLIYSKDFETVKVWIDHGRDHHVMNSLLFENKVTLSLSLQAIVRTAL